MNTLLSAIAGLRPGKANWSKVARHRKPADLDALPSPTKTGAAGEPLHPTPDAGPVPVDAIAPWEHEGFTLLSSAEVERHVRLGLETQFSKLPRPPRAFHDLLSLDALARASSAHIGELVIGEPIVAARILARVNSSMYGARAPILQIGQAVTFLGLHSVRNICLRYFLDESFKSADPALRAALNRIGEASSIASDLAHRFARFMELDDSSHLGTHVVLSFTGHLACAMADPSAATAVPESGGNSLVERCQRQQLSIGLAAPEVGRLLLSSWGLPRTLTDDVASVDRVMLPPRGAPSLASQRSAIAFVCARLGERIASGQLDDNSDLQGWLLQDPDLRFLNSHMGAAAYAKAIELMASSDVLDSVRNLSSPGDVGQTAA